MSASVTPESRSGDQWGLRSLSMTWARTPTLPGWQDVPAVRSGEVWVLDGPAHFNRPGPRVVRGAEVLAHVLHGVRAGEPVTTAEAVRLG